MNTTIDLKTAKTIEAMNQKNQPHGQDGCSPTSSDSSMNGTK